MKNLSVITWILTIVLHASLLFSVIPENNNIEVEPKKSPQKIKVTLSQVVETPKPIVPVVKKTKPKKLTTKKVLKKIVTTKTIITDNPMDIDTVSVPEPEMVQVTEVVNNDDFIYSDELVTVTDDAYFNSVLDEYKLKLRRQIASKKTYPKKARRLNQTGVVKVQFNLAKDGTVIDTFIYEESKYQSLNASALNTIQQFTKLEKIPEELNCDSKTFIIPIVYNLK